MATTGKFVPGDFSLRVGRSSAGLGLFAGSEIPKGACIIEYVGRVISKEEERTSRSKYLFEVSKRKTIDGKPKINKAGYINHSCKPNAETEIYKDRVFILATRRIRPGEEISYDYGKEYVDEHIKPLGCKCGKCPGKKG
ncbi:MAG TPA: SET domain-containing protein [Candidatus Paceibacterota bacterium]|nr:SET domain-containing protein [Candidatus Paceibacterota bacterium]